MININEIKGLPMNGGIYFLILTDDLLERFPDDINN